MLVFEKDQFLKLIRLIAETIPPNGTYEYNIKLLKDEFLEYERKRKVNGFDEVFLRNLERITNNCINGHEEITYLVKLFDSYVANVDFPYDDDKYGKLVILKDQIMNNTNDTLNSKSSSVLHQEFIKLALINFKYIPKNIIMPNEDPQFKRVKRTISQCKIVESDQNLEDEYKENEFFIFRSGLCVDIKVILPIDNKVDGFGFVTLMSIFNSKSSLELHNLNAWLQWLGFPGNN